MACNVTSCPLVIGGDTRCDTLCPRTCRDKVGESGVTHSEPTAKRTGGEGEGEEKRGKRRK